MKNVELENLMKNIDSIPVVNTDTIAVEYKKLRLINDTIADMLKEIRGKYETWEKLKVMTIQFHNSIAKEMMLVGIKIIY